MQETVYQSKEVRVKVADLLVVLQRFYDADTRTVEDMLNEAELFLKSMKRDYFPELWSEVLKMNEGKQREGGKDNK